MIKTSKLLRGETLSFIRAALCGVVALSAISLTATRVQAGEDSKAIAAEMSSPECDKNWATELSSGVLFSNVRTGPGNSYTLVPIQLAGIMKIDDVSLDQFLGGVFRGNTEFLFRGDFYEEVFGQETHLAGLSVGPRYNFVQPGWKIVPFVEGTVGFLFADSNPELINGGNDQRGLGQDFNFTFGVAGGFRYDITDDFYVRLACDYMHVSNAGLSEPAHENKAIDALGPKLSVGYRF